MKVWLVITSEELEPEFILANVNSLTRNRKILVDNIDYNNVADRLMALLKQRGEPLGRVFLFEGISLVPGAKQLPLATIHSPTSHITNSGE